MALLTTNPKLLVIAFLGGLIPSLLWLWFWLKEDDKHPEPKSMLSIVFIMGMLAVMVVLPIQKFIQTHIGSSNLEVILWASAEEILKYFAVLAVLYKTTIAEEPIDWPIYLVTLLHTISSGIIGIAIGLSFFMKEWKKGWFLAVGFIVAITLHSAFNFFIMSGNGSNFLRILAFLWVVTIIVMLLFEKVRRISEKIIN